MNDNDKWLILDTEPLKRLYGSSIEGDEYFRRSTREWITCAVSSGFSTVDTYRRLRSKAWLKAGEHPMQFPAYVCAPTGNVFYLPNAANAPQTGTPAQWLWQPAPQLPEPPAKEDACEKAWREWSATRNNPIGHHAFKAGWEARGGK